MRRDHLTVMWCMCDVLVLLDPWVRLLVAGLLLGGLMGVALRERESICQDVWEWWHQWLGCS